MSTDRNLDIEDIHDQIWETIDQNDNLKSAREDLGLTKYEATIYYAYIGLGTFYSMYDMLALLETAKAKDKITDSVYQAIMTRLNIEKESENVSQQNATEV